MTDTDRYRLTADYAQPAYRLGDVVTCLARGEVHITAVSAGRIPWPRGCRLSQGRRGEGLVLFAGLSDAVRAESAQAVAHWWGVTAQTVSAWRKVLGVEQTNEGTLRLRREYAQEPPAEEARRAASAKAGDPERRARIRAAKVGVKRDPETVEKMRAAATGRKHSPEARARMSAERKARGLRPPKAGRPWTAEEDALLVQGLSAAEVAERTGRTLPAVYSRRRELGVPDGRRR